MRALPLLTLVLLLLPGAVQAAENAPGTFRIGYLEIENDARYQPPRAYAGIEVRPLHRPLQGAQLGVRDSRVTGRALGLTFELEYARAADASALRESMDRLYREKAVRFFLVDAPAAALSSLAAHAGGREILLFNPSEPADDLRAAGCSANLMHTLPSHAMLADALAQFLKSRGWDDILLLRGQMPADREISQAFETAAGKFGLDITAVRDVEPGNDPRRRDHNNISLITTGVNYDTVFVADTLARFGRLTPYHTRQPRPVVGTEGLVATAWHWAWERHGAPQLNQRFEKRMARPMLATDWAAWIAVRAIVESLARTGSTDFAAVEKFLKSDGLRLDGYKGTPMSFRQWNNQLRQSILLTTHNAVIEHAPLPGFLHPTQYMDTLGIDRPANRCRFGAK